MENKAEWKDEIYTYEKESNFWKYAVPTFLVLALAFFIIQLTH